MPKYRIVKQLKPTPQTGDAWWAERKVYVAKLDDSDELTGSDDSGRKYKVIEVGE